MSFLLTIRHRFPGALQQREYYSLCSAALHRVGFLTENTLVAVSRCRDEITSSLTRLIENDWGPTFELASLAGLFSAGPFGLQAALTHIPELGGRAHFVLFAMTHVGIDDDGAIGLLRRDRRSDQLPTCGSWSGFADALGKGRLRRELDPNDVEQSRTELRLAPIVGRDFGGDLADLAQLALGAVEADINAALIQLHRTKRDRPLGFDGALFTGVQINGPYDRTYVWPSVSVIELHGRIVEDAALPSVLAQSR